VAGATPNLLPILAVVAATASFQVGAALAKGLYPTMGPEGAAAVRLVLGAAVLLAFARPWRRWPTGARVAPLIGLGVAAGGAVLFFYLAIDRLPLAIAISLQFLGPLAVAVLGSRKPSDLLWAALAAGGVWSLVGAGAGGVQAFDLLGIGFALAAAASWAAYILVGRVASAAFGATTAALATSVSAILVLPVGVATAGSALLTPALLPLALVVAVISVAVPFSLEAFALPRLPARTFAVLTSLEPAWGVLSGLILLGERLALLQVAGVAMVMSAAAGAAWSSSARKPAAVPEAPPA
jgi:inner membrane transporter RhtA